MTADRRPQTVSAAPPDTVSPLTTRPLVVIREYSARTSAGRPAHRARSSNATPARNAAAADSRTARSISAAA
ncbi:hypothetical protein ACFWNT_39495 [Streptomyces sp. NPDC058409]|uniref:hypothetical protein n=1 Tax=Streptomyces sp. NPDC058409 TaxID=3346484 RepID=UPI0036646336